MVRTDLDDLLDLLLILSGWPATTVYLAVVVGLAALQYADFLDWPRFRRPALAAGYSTGVTAITVLVVPFCMVLLMFVAFMRGNGR